MSKEQTPITAEEFRNDYAKKLQYLNWDDLCEDLWSKGDAMTKTENEVMEQYAQYRERKAVLEALKREIVGGYMTAKLKNHGLPYGLQYLNLRDEAETEAESYYQTQVKPKYKL